MDPVRLTTVYAKLKATLDAAGETDCPPWLHKAVWDEQMADKVVPPKLWGDIITAVGAIANSAVNELSASTLPPWALDRELVRAQASSRGAERDSSGSEAPADTTLTVAAGAAHMVKTLAQMGQRSPPPFAFQQAVIQATLQAVADLNKAAAPDARVPLAHAKRASRRQLAFLYKTGLGDLLASALVEYPLSCVNAVPPPHSIQ